MNAKLRYRLLSALVALCMVLVLFPAVALAAEGDVAQIGDTTYGTLKAAIDAAVDGDTVELLSDAVLPTTSIPSGKTITIDGNGFTIDANQAYLNVAGNVTFENCTMNMHGVPNGHWMYIYMASNGVLTFRNATVTIDGTDAADNTTAMYFPEPNTPRADVNIENSTVTIQNCRGNGISWGGKPNNGYNRLNITGSTVTIDNCAEKTAAGGGGIIGTFDITLTGSNLTVENNKSYGSNGSNYYIDSSVVTYSNNGTHGLSATDLVIENGSQITAEDNGYYGVCASAAFLVDSTSTVTVTKNSEAGDYAGLKLTSGANGLVKAGAVVTITDNYCSGLSNNGKVVFEEGAKLTIMNNVNDKGTTSNGGGVYNSGSSANLTLPSDAVIYNNHADSAGDDIFSNTTSTIIFGKVGADWVLDDCNQMIDGWYDDSNGTRWEAHAETEEGNHIAEFTNFDEETGLATVTGLTALKAAHGAEGKDKTSYPGLDKVIVTEGEDGMLVDAKEDTAAAGDTVNFKLTTNVPDDLLNYINLPDVDDPSVVNVLADEPVRGSYQLVIHDQMDDELVLDPESIVVTLGKNDVLIPVDQYTVAYDVAHDDGTICDFEITLDLVNLYEMGAITEEDIDNATPITVTYTATLAEDVTAGEYLNTAWVTYPEGESEKDTVKVKTYGIDIFKYDQALGVDGENAGLAGAEFALYGADDVTVAEEDGTVTVNPDADPILTVTSGEDGDVVINGLDKGVYYLMETKAPEGYVQSTTPLKVTIPDDADETTYLVEVNFANAQVPHTGGAGTLMYTVGGAAIILLAGALLLISRYSRKKQVG